MTAPLATSPDQLVVDDDLVGGDLPAAQPRHDVVPVRGEFRKCAGSWQTKATCAGQLMGRRWINGHKDCPCPDCQMADQSDRLRSVRDRWRALARGRRSPSALHVGFDLPESLRHHVTSDRQGAYKALCIAALKAAAKDFGQADVNGDAHFHSAGPNLQRLMNKFKVTDPRTMPAALRAKYDAYKPHVHALIPVLAGSALATLVPALGEGGRDGAEKAAERNQHRFQSLLTKHYRKRLARFVGVKVDALPETHQVFLRLYAGRSDMKRFSEFVLREELRGFPGWPTHAHLSTFGPWRKLGRALAAEARASRPVVVPAAALPFEVLQRAGTFEGLRIEEQQVVQEEYRAWQASEEAGAHNGTYAPQARQEGAGCPNTLQSGAAEPAFGGHGKVWWGQLNLMGVVALDPTEVGPTSAAAVRRNIEKEDVLATRFGLRRLLERLPDLRRDSRPEARAAAEQVESALLAIREKIDTTTRLAPSRRRAGEFLREGIRRGLGGDTTWFDESTPFGVCALLPMAELAPLFATLRAVPKVPKRLPLAA